MTLAAKKVVMKNAMTVLDDPASSAEKHLVALTAVKLLRYASYYEHRFSCQYSE